MKIQLVRNEHAFDNFGLDSLQKKKELWGPITEKREKKGNGEKKFTDGCNYVKENECIILNSHFTD